MKKLLAAVLASVAEIITWLETDPAILSAMPKEMASFQASTSEMNSFRQRIDDDD